jgi:hypothetical protein
MQLLEINHCLNFLIQLCQSVLDSLFFAIDVDEEVLHLKSGQLLNLKVPDSLKVDFRHFSTLEVYSGFVEGHVFLAVLLLDMVFGIVILGLGILLIFGKEVKDFGDVSQINY